MKIGFDDNDDDFPKFLFNVSISSEIIRGLAIKFAN
jgi:hypothetical protein